MKPPMYEQRSLSPDLAEPYLLPAYEPIETTGTPVSGTLREAPFQPGDQVAPNWKAGQQRRGIVTRCFTKGKTKPIWWVEVQWCEGPHPGGTVRADQLRRVETAPEAPFQVGDRVRVVRGCCKGLESTVTAIQPDLKHSIVLEPGKGRFPPNLLEKVPESAPPPPAPPKFQKGDYVSPARFRPDDIGIVEGGRKWIRVRWLTHTGSSREAPGGLVKRSPDDPLVVAAVKQSLGQPGDRVAVEAPISGQRYVGTVERLQGEQDPDAVVKLDRPGYPETVTVSAHSLHPPEPLSEPKRSPDSGNSRPKRYSRPGQASGWIEERVGNKKRKTPTTSYFYCFDGKEDGRQKRTRVYVPVGKMARVRQMVDQRCSVEEILQVINQAKSSTPHHTHTPKI